MRDGHLEPGANELVRAWQLGAYAYTRLGPDDVGRSEFQLDYAAAVYQHLMTRTALLPLVRAWHEAGIDVLIFKGFYLSELVYDRPGVRTYSDVDLLIQESQAREATRIAQAMGWLVTWRLEESLVPHHHEVFHLQSSDGLVNLDVHRRLLHNLLPDAGRQQRITEAAWAAAQRQDWYGTPIWTLDPRDAVLIGLVLQRAWGDDSWLLKRYDWPDFAILIDRYQLSFDVLKQRARQLGCVRTFSSFLEICDPHRGTLHMRPRSRAQYFRWCLQLLPERPTLLMEHSLFKAWSDLQKLRDVAGESPHVLHVLWQLRRDATLDELLSKVSARAERLRLRHPHQSAEVSERNLQHVRRGVSLTLALLRVRPGGNCLERALSVYASLRACGLEPVFCSGVAREAGTFKSHAWVELAGQNVSDDPPAEAADIYRRNYVFPDAGH